MLLVCLLLFVVPIVGCFAVGCFVLFASLPGVVVLVLVVLVGVGNDDGIEKDGWCGAGGLAPSFFFDLLNAR